MNATSAVLDGSAPVEEPIRAEIFGIERLEQHAESLAAAHRAAAELPKSRKLLPRVRQNAAVLLASYRQIAETVLAKQEITPAAEWILDNYHVVDEQLREIRDHLPRSYYRLLPKTGSGHLAGFPRVYGLAWAYVAHTDSRFERETLQRFVQAYQRVQPLTIGELWAVAIHLRVALVENLRRLAQLIVGSRRARARADELADRLLGLSSSPPELPKDVLGSLSDGPLTCAFAVQLVQRLRGQDPSVMPALAWLEHKLTEQGASADKLVAEEHQAQAAASVSVRNIITSMRWISSANWPEFFEGVSAVDEVLRAAPGFAAMDFPTRDDYRSRIESLSRGSRRPEDQVARAAVEQARLAGEERRRDPPTRNSHPAGAVATSAERGLDGVPERAEEDPGYYLSAGGRRAFERSLGFRTPLRIRLRQAVRALAITGYLAGIAGLTALLLLGLLQLSWTAGAAPASLALLAALGLVPASDIAMALVQRLVPFLVPPRLLPKLELADGVPAELRTLVVVPTLVTRAADIAGQLERLEVHFLSNPEGHLQFALLTDWADAAEESVAGDTELLAALAAGIEQMNLRHGPAPGGAERFLLLHRRRLWNAKEGKWMGWERKRGKLHELNRLLRGASNSSFLPVNGRLPTVPPGVRYVLTLDADTRLPRGAVRRLVGAMAHPLNRPRFDPRKGRVVSGYAILQPRLTPSLPTGPQSTVYQRIISGPGGVEPYAAAVSDVYQDLFGEGSYTGKGIYEVDTFEAALDGKVPANTLLSHDLFEGCFARAGLATDVDLFEEFPTNYEVAARRQHRWARGDWQLLPWILGRASGIARASPVARIPAHGLWKMVDNLRRSLAAPSAFLLAVAAWTLPDVPPLLWTGLFVGAFLVPALIPVLDGLIPRRWGVSKRSHMNAVRHDVVVALSQTALAITMLAHQAWLMVDAVARTLGRLYLTHRNLLEWVTAAQAGHGADLRLKTFFWDLRWGVILGALAGLSCLVLKPQAWPVATPFVLLWIVSPVLAWRISTPFKIARSATLSPPESLSLRLIARRTWGYFEAFVNPENHALPPDNFQEDPAPIVAHRTSPTNIGLYLLSTTVAHDFGWIGIHDCVDRLEATLETMAGMQRVHGHFLNWYDTRSLQPLEPRYISTVDSGNLAGHLIAVAQACRGFLTRGPPDALVRAGVQDSLQLLVAAMERTERGRPAAPIISPGLSAAATALSVLLQEAPKSSPEWARRLDALEGQAAGLLALAHSFESEAVAETEVLTWAKRLQATVRSHARDQQALVEAAGDLETRLAALVSIAEDMVHGMDFGALFDSSRKLFSIGYRVADGTLDPSSYDLLASEARLASFVAIAKGDVAPQHWFSLGRSLTPVGRGAALVSWSGSMFEYLMPLLVMRQPPESLLDLTCRLVVGRQMRYGTERRVPWGVSESAYNLRDVHLTYQYSAFGVPGLGLKRGLFENVVVAPYATALAAMVDFRAALSNFARLEEAGARGAFGFYDAIDYTPSRLPENTQAVVVRAYMAHHQGMTVVSLGNVVHDGLTRRRFHSHPMVQAAELLLQERTPRSVAVTRPRGEEVRVASLVRELVPPNLRHFESPHDITPRTHLLSNGRYTVMITAAGAGFSRRGDLALTRWREDPTRDCWGSFVYLRDARSGALWSAGFQPSATEMEDYQVVYAEDRAKISQRDRSLAITLEVVVSTVDDAELRRLTVSNLEGRERNIELTSYAEVVLASQAADEAHPAFSNLFVETEFVAAQGTLLARRRPRATGEPTVWLAHLAMTEARTLGELEYETDRARFLGRGRDVRAPRAVTEGGPLSNTTGTVLDPIVSLRRCVVIPPRGTISIVFTTLVASSRQGALEAAEKYRQPATFDRESTLAWTQAQVRLHHLQISQEEAHLFQRLANRLLFTDPTLRAEPRELARNQTGQSGLWAYGISGDLPIAVVSLDQNTELHVVQQLLRAHEYWHSKGISADLVILNEKGTSYLKELHEAVESMVRASPSAAGHEAPGHQGRVLVLREDLLSPASRTLLRSAARLLILAHRGTLSEQVVRTQQRPPRPPPPLRRAQPEEAAAAPPPRLELEFFNGLGGFTPDGREYVTVLEGDRWTPAPWINVVANPTFGFQVSESGAGSTWSVNSRENKLTPWSNDSISDPPGEILYVRDEDSGRIWGPTCLPIREHAEPYVIRHGQGYSRFEHTAHGIALDLLMLVPPQDPVKISRLTLQNRSDRTRRLSVTAYAEWTLGVARTSSAPYVVTQIDPVTGALLARNDWNAEFAGRVAFADLGGKQTSWTGDRLEFLGRNTSLDRPESLQRGDAFSGRTGAGMDPCAALKTIVALAPGERVEVLFLLGQGSSIEEARSLVARYRETSGDSVLRDVREQWDGVLNTVQVQTPDRAMDLLLNRWLLYQTLSCRIWARAAFYQSGGAYGFRDQLQDVLALAVTRPDVAREHILRAAARQFPEGDVQHWWHPPAGRGVRTRISDDRLWLPYVVVHYLQTTADQAILDQEVPWIEGTALDQDQQEHYFEPVESEERATLYEHCARALDRSLTHGSHGLPLIGGGDWNDGMNNVGPEGRGESVWLGWFLLSCLRGFAPLADRCGDHERAVRWREHAVTLAASVEREAWDGAWYRRAYFDDGTPLGSASSDECRIDSISQSWAVLSGTGNIERARQAMESVQRHLVRRDERLLLLLSPPFDRTPRDPGYIKAYPPGIRENGGQYTHAAIWSVLAFAELGEGDRAADLFALLNPIQHALRPEDVARYMVEPYAVAADIYSEPPHLGRGGWTWYTGAAGWFHRAGLEWILGFRKQGNALRMDPCVPRDWPGFEICYRHGSTPYRIAVENPRRVCRGVTRVEVDGVSHPQDELVPLVDDGREHHIRVVLG